MPSFPSCPLHGSTQARPLFTANGHGIFQCQESTCGLMFADPRPPQSYLAGHYGPSYFQNYRDRGISGQSYASMEKYVRQLTKRRLQKLPAGMKKCLLDGGCAYGFSLQAAASLGYTGLYGVEISEHAKSEAHKRSPRFRLWREIFEVDIPKGTLDVVTMWEYIEHVADPWEVLVKAYDLLRPGGFLALSTPDAELVVHDLEKLRTWEHMRPPEHLYYFTRKALRLLLYNAGFEVLDVTDDTTPAKAGGALAFMNRAFSQCFPRLHARFYEPIKGAWLRMGSPGAQADEGLSFEVYARRTA